MLSTRSKRWELTEANDPNVIGCAEVVICGYAHEKPEVALRAPMGWAYEEIKGVDVQEDIFRRRLRRRCCVTEQQLRAAHQRMCQKQGWRPRDIILNFKDTHVVRFPRKKVEDVVNAI